jgi:hypothetical protein
LNVVFSIQILNVIFTSPGVLRLGPEAIAKKYQSRSRDYCISGFIAPKGAKKRGFGILLIPSVKRLG